LKGKRVLISQPQPENDKSPYADVARQFGLEITFRKFFLIESVGAKEFRKNRIHIPDYSAVIFTSKHAADHFFSLCDELRVQVSEQTKYFCTSEAIALYLQKYVQYRKRKIFFGKNHFSELLELIKKQKDEKFLFPCGENHKKGIPQLLKQNKVQFTSAPIYRTVAADLSDIDISEFDMLVFFSPFGFESLRTNFPDYVQGDTLLATFGDATAKAAKKAGLTVHIPAPTETAPSMTMAIQEYLQKQGKK
jgi:uroporphyrinogen-III synthase